MRVLITIIAVVFAILQIILFFKIWGMTNDIRDMKKYIIGNNNNNNNVDTIGLNLERKLQIGSHIIEIKTKKQMKVMLVENKDGITKYICSSNNGVTNNTFNGNEIELFSVFQDENK